MTYHVHVGDVVCVRNSPTVTVDFINDADHGVELNTTDDFNGHIDAHSSLHELIFNPTGATNTATFWNSPHMAGDKPLHSESYTLPKPSTESCAPVQTSTSTSTSVEASPPASVVSKGPDLNTPCPPETPVRVEDGSCVPESFFSTTTTTMAPPAEPTTVATVTTTRSLLPPTGGDHAPVAEIGLGAVLIGALIVRLVKRPAVR